MPRRPAADPCRASGAQSDGEGSGSVDLLDRAELAERCRFAGTLLQPRGSAVVASGSYRTARGVTLFPQNLGRR